MSETEVRVLVAAHAWEGKSKGGAERAAAALVQALNELELVDARLVACIPDSGVIHQHSPMGLDEHGTILIRSQTDWDFFSWTSPEMARHWLDLLKAYQPDVVHLHHYAQTGIELPALVKAWRPETQVVVTLHEFLAMCPQGGQMIHRSGALCSSFGALRCSDCKSWSVEHWAARDAYIRQGLRQVDHFIAPSEFLRQRYLAWGLEPHRIRQVPNVTRPVQDGCHRRASHGSASTRVVFLSQHTPNKGVETLLKAAILVERRKSAPGLRVELYGGGAERFGETFARRVCDLAEKAKGIVSVHGAFENEGLDAILAGADFVVVPSTWWENSPVVIQEAFARGIPVIASDLGGMAEQVSDGVNGMLFRAGDAEDLARALEKAVQATDWVVTPPPSALEVAERHRAIYAYASSAPVRYSP